MPSSAITLVYLASIWVLPLVIAITFHEAAHGWVANRLGDDTARRMGRVTFNPLRHIDPVGTVLLPALLIVFGAPFVFGYAKPVPVNFARLHHPKRDMVWVALAGPAVNLALALAAGALYHLVPYFSPWLGRWIAHNLENALLINVVLAVFNMLPLPPLDGGRVLTGLLPVSLAVPFARIERFGMPILITLLFVLPFVGREIGVNLNLIAWVLGPPINALLSVVLTVTGHG